MNIEQLKNFSKQASKTFGFTLICVYLGYHLISGQNGLINYFKQKAKLEQLENELSEVEHKRDNLQNKVYKLHPASLDADLLDEQYRRSSGKIKESEAIYYYDN